MDLPTLMDRCAPEVGRTTIAAIIQAESKGNPLAIGLNGDNRLARQPRDLAEAVRWARWFVARGYSVDIGLMQVNAKNMARLGVSIERAFDPCVNIRAGSLVLREFYQTARNAHGSTEMALHAALSAYNTGSLTKGFSNGYVKKVIGRQPDAWPPMR